VASMTNKPPVNAVFECIRTLFRFPGTYFVVSTRIDTRPVLELNPIRPADLAAFSSRKFTSPFVGSAPVKKSQPSKKFDPFRESINFQEELLVGGEPELVLVGVGRFVVIVPIGVEVWFEFPSDLRGTCLASLQYIA